MKKISSKIYMGLSKLEGYELLTMYTLFVICGFMAVLMIPKSIIEGSIDIVNLVGASITLIVSVTCCYFLLKEMNERFEQLKYAQADDNEESENYYDYGN